METICSMACAIWSLLYQILQFYSLPTALADLRPDLSFGAFFKIIFINISCFSLSLGACLSPNSGGDPHIVDYQTPIL